MPTEHPADDDQPRLADRNATPQDGPENADPAAVLPGGPLGFVLKPWDITPLGPIGEAIRQEMAESRTRAARALDQGDGFAERLDAERTAGRSSPPR